MHPEQFRHIGIDIVVNSNFMLPRMFPVEPPRILYDSTLPALILQIRTRREHHEQVEVGVAEGGEKRI
jgi:hypothetical protein